MHYAAQRVRVKHSGAHLAPGFDKEAGCAAHARLLDWVASLRSVTRDAFDLCEEGGGGGGGQRERE
jgi:hypothetical protein